MIACASGHRTGKLGKDYISIENKLRGLARHALETELPARLYIGMALGWDTAIAEAAEQLGIPYIAAVPCIGQESVWPYAAQKRYHLLLSRAAEVVVVGEGSYSPKMMQDRNEYMVDHSQMVIALWNGTKGGTYNCLQYAKQKKVAVVNYWDLWISDYCNKTY